MWIQRQGFDVTNNWTFGKHMFGQRFNVDNQMVTTVAPKLSVMESSVRALASFRNQSVCDCWWATRH